MPGRPHHIPVYRERSALQSLVEKGWLPAAKLYPAGPSTIFGMLAKGWLQRKRDPTFGWTYRITATGEAAVKVLIPSKPHMSARAQRGLKAKGK
jgi:hypothetical protein